MPLVILFYYFNLVMTSVLPCSTVKNSVHLLALSSLPHILHVCWQTIFYLKSSLPCSC